MQGLLSNKERIINHELQTDKKKMRQGTILLLCTVVLFARCSFAERTGDSAQCRMEYENHNSVDYGPLVVQEVKGTIVDPQQGPVPRVCVGLFTEKEHRVLATVQSDTK